MLILFDHGTPAPLLSFLVGHTVTKTKDLGWDRLSNGELLKAAEEAGYEILVTTDKNIRYHHKLTGRRSPLVLLAKPRGPVVRRSLHRVVTSWNAASPGTYTEVDIPNQ